MDRPIWINGLSPYYLDGSTKSKFSAEEILAIIREGEAGGKIAEICHQHGISEATFYRWKARVGHIDTRQKVRLLEEENSRLKRIVADLALSNAFLKDQLRGKE